EANAVERGRNNRYLDLHRVQVAHDLRALVAGERIARHLDDALAFEDAVARAARMRIPDPAHVCVLPETVVVIGSTAAAGLAFPQAQGVPRAVAGGHGPRNRT